MKDRAEREPRPLLQIFQEEQTEYARAVGDVDVVEENLPQFGTIASGLYKQKESNVPKAGIRAKY
jgi:hypothetical protein